jgi:hypothetical protein
MPKPVAHPKLRLVKPQAPSLAQEQPHFALSKPGDALEREADRAAEAVMTGRPVAAQAAFSFGDVAVGHIQRQDAPGPTPPAQQTDEDKYKEAALKVGEAALKTEAGKKLLEKVENDKLVREGKRFFDTTAGKIVVGTIAAGGAAGLVGGLAAAKKPLPFQLPEIPVSDTLKLGLTIEGPLNQPTSGMLTITFSESGKKSSGKKSGSELSRETAELRRSLEMFKPKPAEEKKKADSKERARSRQLEDASKALKRWIDQDVSYIITNEERTTWKRLTTDESLARSNPRNFLNRAPVTFAYDFNRDSFVNATDQLLARDNAMSAPSAFGAGSPIICPA